MSNHKAVTEELEKIKLEKEISLLEIEIEKKEKEKEDQEREKQEQNAKAPWIKFLKNFYKKLNINLGILAAIIASFFAIINPLLKYIEKQESARSIQINKDMIDIMLKLSEPGISEATKRHRYFTLQIFDPKATIPFLLYDLNTLNPDSSKLEFELTTKTIIDVYTIYNEKNNPLKIYTDRLPDIKKDILDNASYTFKNKLPKSISDGSEDPDNAQNLFRLKAYLEIVTTLKLGTEQVLSACTDTLYKHKSENNYAPLAELIEKLHDQKINEK